MPPCTSLRPVETRPPSPFTSKLALFATLAALCALSVAAQESAAGLPRDFETKFALAVVTGETPGASRPAMCSARMVEGSSELTLLCRHELGSAGEVSLVRAGSGARSELPYWSAPLASPFEAVATLSEAAMAVFAAGELTLRIDTGAAGVVAEGTLGTPIFDSGFQEFSLCEWSNFPCPSDGNVCTTETCSSTGVCGHQNNANPCPLPNATGGCAVGTCAIIVSCNPGFSHCDSSQLNGCETAHNTSSASCASASPSYVGEGGADTQVRGAFEICGSPFTDNFANRTGLGEAWYSATAAECSTCDASLRHTITLEVPPGVDWDLFVYRGCTLVDSSIGGTGVDEMVEVTQAENFGSDDSFPYVVEVRYFSGRSCEEWSLSFFGVFGC